MAVKYNAAILLMVTVAAAIVEGLAAKTYHVGDNSGWQVPTGGFSFSNWTAQHSFVAGDILEFDFITGQHTAAKVSQNDYENCNTANPITIQTTGPANYTLNSGESYFICTRDNHCSQGQKLAVNVASSTGSPTGSPAPSTTPPGSSTNNTTTSPPPPPPPSSATPTAIAASSLIFLSIFMAFVC